MITLQTKIRQLNKIGEKLEKKFKNLGIETVQELLFHFPHRYEDYSKIVDIKDVNRGEAVTVKAKIELLQSKRSKWKRTFLTEALISDKTGKMRVIWFGQPFIAKTLRVGEEVYFSGTPSIDRLGIVFSSPIYEKATKDEPIHTARIIPVYPSTFGLTQKQIRFFLGQVIKLAAQLDEWIPKDIFINLGLVSYGQAISQIHFPENRIELEKAHARLKFDELFLLQLRAKFIREMNRVIEAPQINFQEDKIKEFVKGLPFELTRDQKVVAWQILQDVEKKNPMNRLLQGDVGSGKTVVAVMACLSVVLNGFEAAFMAPTEILAKQHFESLKKLLTGKVNLALVTRTSRIFINTDGEEVKLSKAKMIELLKNGGVGIVVGTHALVAEGIYFKNLGLVVVDEQHRFGVEQRKTLKEKSGLINKTPHFLTMSATPIPRSLALILCGDLDISFIRQKPSGRKEILTRAIGEEKRNKAYGFIREQIKKGRQAFVVCPLIENEEGEVNEKKSVLDVFNKLSTEIFKDLKVGYLHGKLKPGEKDETMQKFLQKELDILVSTSVVEVGVDVPNASVMMIEGAENFGLAQLHQFRGRVGRSEHQSYCFLFSSSASDKAWERLNFFEQNTDGLKIAEYDLSLRGPGEVYGKMQSGKLDFKLASIEDRELINRAKQIVDKIDIFKYKDLVVKLKEWEKGIHLE